MAAGNPFVAAILRDGIELWHARGHPPLATAPQSTLAPEARISGASLSFCAVR